MKIFSILLGVFITSSVYADVCEVNKNQISISGLELGKSVLKLKQEHPKSLFLDFENNRANISYVHSNDFDDAFHGTPATSSGYVEFDGNTKLIKGFSISFNHLSAFSAANYKNGLIALYSLPKNGWIESKRNGVQSFKYTCSTYSLEIYFNPERESFMVVKETS